MADHAAASAPSPHMPVVCADHGRRPYPETLAVSGPNMQTIAFLQTTKCRVIAEIGIYEGDTSEMLAAYLGGEGELHLFDYDDRVAAVYARLHAAGYRNVVGHGNSRKLADSYNWSLLRLLRAHTEAIFDFVFLDGAHTWDIDALAFLLSERLLKNGGYVDFDDYNWSLKTSPSLNPRVFPPTADMYTDEQIEERHVRLIVDVLVRRDSRFIEIVPNKIFQKQTVSAQP